MNPIALIIVRLMDTLLLGRADGVVTVTMSRPRKNAITVEMENELIDVLREVAARREDRVLVLTGADGEFCSGADLSDPGTLTDDGLFYMRRVGEMILDLHQLPKPTIAKVPGVAAGLGCNVALACDLIVAADTARFSEIFARRGLSLDGGGSWLLGRRHPAVGAAPPG